MYKIYYGNSLYHHGIKGMRWGIRRYTNPDGTLTDKGRRHYSRQVARLSRLGNRASAADARYEQYKDTFNAIDRVYRSKGPMAYGRWYSSSSTQSQKQYLSQLGRKAMHSTERVKKLMNKLSSELKASDYTLGYDVINEQYNLIKR